MLGYEPTVVESRLSLLDYSRCAFDMGLTPAEFLDHRNPMFTDGQQRLSNYTTDVAEFDHAGFQILIINDSMTSLSDRRLLGVLHTAKIINPVPGQLRVVNSMMIDCNAGEPVSDVSTHDQQEFIYTDVNRKPVQP